jgi:hypothetical protein
MLRTLQAYLGSPKYVRPEMVVMETLGNSETPCMVDPDSGVPAAVGSPGYFAQYRADIRTFADDVTAAGAQVMFEAPPPTRKPSANPARQASLCAAVLPCARPNPAT